jgi:hypothetical protein
MEPPVMVCRIRESQTDASKREDRFTTHKFPKSCRQEPPGEKVEDWSTSLTQAANGVKTA